MSAKTQMNKGKAKMRKILKQATRNERPNFYSLVPNPNKPEYTKLRAVTYRALDLTTDVKHLWLMNVWVYIMNKLLKFAPHKKES